jgi:hypothetical protein
VKFLNDGEHYVQFDVGQRGGLYFGDVFNESEKFSFLVGDWLRTPGNLL